VPEHPHVRVLTTELATRLEFDLVVRPVADPAHSTATLPGAEAPRVLDLSIASRSEGDATSRRSGHRTDVPVEGRSPCRKACDLSVHLELSI